MAQASANCTGTTEFTKDVRTIALSRLPARLFHSTLAQNVPAIERLGLQSADALMRAAGLAPLERRHFREKTTFLAHGAALRDQKPMAPALLASCLDQPLVPSDWYEMVNARVFFWIDKRRLERYLAASADYDQVVFTIETRKLINRYADCLEVTPFNVGYAKRFAAPRGARTFVRLSDWAQTFWQGEALGGVKPRTRRQPPAEIAARCSIPDFRALVTARRFLKQCAAVDLRKRSRSGCLLTECEKCCT